MKRHIPLYLTVLLLSAVPLRAQDKADISRYEQEAGGLSTLFRGRLQNPLPYRYNGTFYLETRTFTPGDILYNGKLYTDIPLNLDAYAQELVVRPKANAAGVILYRDQVAWFTLGGRRFVNLRYLGYQRVPEGFFEVLRDGKEPILRQCTKIFRSSTYVSAADEVELRLDDNYSPDVVNHFLSKDNYYLLSAEGKLERIGKGNARRRFRKAYEAEGSPFTDEAFAWHPTVSDGAEGLVPPGGLTAKTPLALPGDWFDSGEKEEENSGSGNAMTVTFRNKLYYIGQQGQSRGGKSTVTGIVYEAETGLPLPGTVIFDDRTRTYARTDRDGRYSITLPAGENVLNFNAESKEDLPLRIEVLSDGTLDVVMTENITYLQGAVISATSMQQHRTTAIGVERINIKTLTKIPTAFGEGDILKAVLTLPGVKTVGEASGGFNVRGGSADQNLILFDDNTIYNPSHLFGIFSAFNPDIIENVELYKSSIPANYGGRISSVLNVSSKKGDLNRFKGSLGIGLLTSRIHLEGPLAKGKSSFIAGARTSYSDWLMKLLPESSAYSGGGARFTDANLGVTHHFDRKRSLTLHGYFATDRFSFSGDTTFRYTNINAAATYLYRDDDGRMLKVSAGYDHYTNIVGAHEWEGGAYDLQTVIRQGFLKAHRERPLGSHTLSYGFDGVGYALDPGIMTPYGMGSMVQEERLKREYALEPSVYAADNWKIGRHFSVDGGVRLSSFLSLQEPRKFYAGPEFRLAGKYSPMTTLSFKAGINTMRQYIHLISNSSAVSPMDTWKLSNARLAPTTGWQAAAGAYWTSPGGWDFSIEGYYKQSRNGLDYKSGAVLTMNPNLDEDLVPVRGRAYGIEAIIKKPAGKLTGWISYGYSRSRLQEMEDRGWDTINGGDWYNAPYDKPHEFKFVGNYAFTHRFSFSVNVDYSTGRPVTIPVGRYQYGGKWRLAYTERGSHRVPDYFRVDAALNIDPGHYLKALAHASVTIGVYNVTGRKNPYSVFFRTNADGELKGYMLSVFAYPIPYINLNIQF